MATAKRPVPEGYSTVTTTAHAGQRRASNRLVQERPWGTGTVAEHGTRRENHARRNPDRQLTHHAERRDGGRRDRKRLAVHRPRSGSMSTIVTLFNNAVSAGATATIPVDNQFWGDRMGVLVDPHSWTSGRSPRTRKISPNRRWTSARPSSTRSSPRKQPRTADRHRGRWLGRVSGRATRALRPDAWPLLEVP